ELFVANAQGESVAEGLRGFGDVDAIRIRAAHASAMGLDGRANEGANVGTGANRVTNGLELARDLVGLDRFLGKHRAATNLAVGGVVPLHSELLGGRTQVLVEAGQSLFDASVLPKQHILGQGLDDRARVAWDRDRDAKG